MNTEPEQGTWRQNSTYRGPWLSNGLGAAIRLTVFDSQSRCKVCDRHLDDHGEWERGDCQNEWRRMDSSTGETDEEIGARQDRESGACCTGCWPSDCSCEADELPPVVEENDPFEETEYALAMARSSFETCGRLLEEINNSEAVVDEDFIPDLLDEVLMDAYFDIYSDGTEYAFLEQISLDRISRQMVRDWKGETEGRVASYVRFAGQRGSDAQFKNYVLRRMTQLEKQLGYNA